MSADRESGVTTVDPASLSAGAAASQPSPGNRHRNLASIIQVVVVALVTLSIAYLVLTPLVYLGIETFFVDGQFTFGAFRRAYSSAVIGDMVRNSLLFAAGSSLLPLVIGTFLAYVVVRTNVPMRRLLVVGAMAPLIVPAILYIISWTMLGGENVGLVNQLTESIFGIKILDLFSMPGMIMVEGFHNVPLAFLFMYVAMRSMDSSLEEAAIVSGASHWSMLRRVTLPMLRPAMAAAFLILLVKGLGSFEVPAILGVPSGIFVFISRIYFEMQDFPYDTAAAGALSMGLIALAVVGVWLLGRVQGDGRSYQTITGKGFKGAPLDLKGSRFVLLGVSLAYILIAVIAPIVILIYNSLLPFYQAFSLEAFSSFTLNNYQALFENGIFAASIWNSAILALGTATLIMLITAVAAWIGLRSQYRWRKLMDQTAFLPIVIPGLVVGLAVSYVYIRNPFPFAVYGTLWIMLIAYVTYFMPYGMRYSMASLGQISNELEEAAAISGASWTQVLRRVILPLMVPGLLAGWVVIVIVSARELAASILLYSPGGEVISILMFRLFEEGQLVVVAALGVILILVFTASVLVTQRLLVRRGLEL